MSKVQHVLKAGLKHGRYYKVYVTQVNMAGLESPKSDPVLIRVGDVTAPPAPLVALDTSYGNGGYLKNKGAVNIALKWARPECDDLDYYILHVWRSFDFYSSDGLYPANTAGSSQQILTASALSYILASQKNLQTICIGLQAVDISNNASQISVIKVAPEDNTILDKPTNPITVVPGVWQITAYTVVPNSDEIAAVLWFRDNLVQIGAVPAYAGQPNIIVDQLAPDTVNETGANSLTHFYTYCYMDANGNLSPRSDPSETVTAKSIDTTLLDKASLEALLDTWNVKNVEDIEVLKSDLGTQAQTINSLASQLSGLTQNFNEMYNEYQLSANKIQLLSAAVEALGESTSSLQTSYTQMASEIQLRAIKIDVDNALGAVVSANASALSVQADRITSIVTNLNNNVMAYSSIAQIANGLQLKVDKGGVISAINMSPETVQIASKYLHITGDVLADGSITVNKLNLANIFPQSNSDSGWLMFPGGVYMQWGRILITTSAADSMYNCYFPRQFPNRCFNVVGTISNTRQSGYFDYGIQVVSWAVNGFTAFVQRFNQNENAQGEYIHWIAFGC